MKSLFGTSAVYTSLILLLCLSDTSIGVNQAHAYGGAKNNAFALTYSGHSNTVVKATRDWQSRPLSHVEQSRMSASHCKSNSLRLNQPFHDASHRYINQLGYENHSFIDVALRNQHVDKHHLQRNCIR